MSGDDDAKVKAVVRLANCVKTESRVRMLLTIRRGATRPLDVIKQSGENPSTLYRVVDEMIETGVVERSEPSQGEVHWRLTDLGERLLASVEQVASSERSPSEPIRTRPPWVHMVLPLLLLVLAGVRGTQEGQLGWIAGGALLAIASYMFTARYVK